MFVLFGSCSLVHPFWQEVSGTDGKNLAGAQLGRSAHGG